MVPEKKSCLGRGLKTLELSGKLYFSTGKGFQGLTSSSSESLFCHSGLFWLVYPDSFQQASVLTMFHQREDILQVGHFWERNRSL